LEFSVVINNGSTWNKQKSTAINKAIISSMNAFEVSGYFPIWSARKFIKAILSFDQFGINSIQEVENCADQYILPGLIDSHVHIESSMVLPIEFGKWVSQFGTVCCLADPHEIANVLGLEGVSFMVKNASKSGIKFFFGAPSCVPATPFETSGAEISPGDIQTLLSTKSCHYLSEMMNYPGVIFDDPGVLEKLHIARSLGCRIDGHAPLLSGEQLKKYAGAGISTDHECSSIEEAREKISLGMKIQIRNGSAARNFQELHPLIPEFPNELMFCTDDCHPDELVTGHINNFVLKGLQLGYNIFDLIQVASINPILHYQLPVGLLKLGDPADFIIVKDLHNFEILETWINGKEIFSEKLKIRDKAKYPNRFYINSLEPDQLKVKIESNSYKIILVKDGQLLTKKGEGHCKADNTFLEADPDKDILKLLVLNRYREAIPQIAFIKGIGLKNGAIASSCAHDSHNIIAVGATDADILQAIRQVQEHKGALVAVNGEKSIVVPLPVAGLMADLSIQEMAEKYTCLNEFVNNLGSTLKSPFMTLSFMALLVIPELKLGDKGLFDGNKFSFVPLFNH
jgi:adenine deaminase